MDYFLSKPIRRPALKHVLKTYCPPIPEENEAATTPPPEQPLQSRPNGQSPRSQMRGLGSVNNAIAPVTIVASPAVADKGKDSPGVSPISWPERVPQISFSSPPYCSTFLNTTIFFWCVPSIPLAGALHCLLVVSLVSCSCAIFVSIYYCGEAWRWRRFECSKWRMRHIWSGKIWSPKASSFEWMSWVLKRSFMAIFLGIEIFGHLAAWFSFWVYMYRHSFIFSFMHMFWG